MIILGDQIAEFQQILKEEYGKELTAGDAIVLAQRLILLHEALYEHGREGSPSDLVEP